MRSQHFAFDSVMGDNFCMWLWCSLGRPLVDVSEREWESGDDVSPLG